MLSPELKTTDFVSAASLVTGSLTEWSAQPPRVSCRCLAGGNLTIGWMGQANYGSCLHALRICMGRHLSNGLAALYSPPTGISSPKNTPIRFAPTGCGLALLFFRL